MKIGIIGLGLIGGSLGRATKLKTAHEVYGRDKDREAVLKAELLNAVDREMTDDDFSQTDLMIVALPLSATLSVIKEVAPKLKSGATLIDCCGNKRDVAAEMKRLSKKRPDVNFAGVHPMAGREWSGISHSMATLFEHSYFILTPIAASLEALAALKAYFSSLGAEGTAVATADEHDKIISYTSQLAHIASSAYIKNPLSESHVGFSAGSFRDMTRVAKLDPDMWTELFLANKDNLLANLDLFIEHLEEYRAAIDGGNAEELKRLLSDGVKMKEQAEKLRRQGIK